MRRTGCVLLMEMLLPLLSTIAADEVRPLSKPASEDAAIVVTVSSLVTNYPFGSAVSITMTVTNLSTNSVTIPNGAAWIEGQFRFGLDITVIGAGQVVFGPLPIPGPCVVPGQKDFVRLAPGKALSIGLHIGEFIPESANALGREPLGKRPGTYTVRVRLVNRHAGFGVPSDKGPVLKKIDDMWIGGSDWAELVITVGQNDKDMHNQQSEGIRR